MHHPTATTRLRTTRRRNHYMTTTLKRFPALMVAIAMAAFAMVGLAHPASAASNALPDPSKTANLHITKMKTPVTGGVGDGTQQATDPAKALSGVQFTIKKV